MCWFRKVLSSDVVYVVYVGWFRDSKPPLERPKNSDLKVPITKEN